MRKTAKSIWSGSNMAEIQTRLSPKHNLLTAWLYGLPWALALLTDDSHSSGIHYSIRLIHITSSLHLLHWLCQSNAVCTSHFAISFFDLFISSSPTYSAVNSWLNYSSLVTGIFFSDIFLWTQYMRKQRHKHSALWYRLLLNSGYIVNRCYCTNIVVTTQ